MDRKTYIKLLKLKEFYHSMDNMQCAEFMRETAIQCNGRKSGFIQLIALATNEDRNTVQQWVKSIKGNRINFGSFVLWCSYIEFTI